MVRAAAASTEPPTAAPLRRVRLCMAVVILGLLVSGVTAFPLETELRLGCRWIGIPDGPPAADAAGLRPWLARVRTGLERTGADYPFVAYGTDWLAFAHLVLAVLFVGPYRDPVRNVWVIDFGLIACGGVLALALIAGPVRGIPFGWRCVDCSFGVLAAVPLMIARRDVGRLNAGPAPGKTGTMGIRVRLAAAVVLIAAGPLPAATPAGPLAFPGAQGFAAHATGGRGCPVYHVTTLDDAGPGSLRDAVSRPRRTVVFDVGGYIRLASTLPVSGDLTLAGQTAPGDGVATLGYEVSFGASSNVIVRHLRFRQGNTPRQEKKSAVAITGGHDLIFDHVSVEWGRWDTVDMNKGRDVTFQDCIIGQGVGPQRFGCLCQCDRVTFVHDLWIDNQSRNPKAKGVPVQFVNNVVYNWGGAGGFVEGHSAADSYDDLAGNYFVAGPDSSPSHAFAMGTATDHVYSADNLVDLDRDGTLNGRPATPEQLGAVTVCPAPSVPFTGDDVTVEPAAAAFAHVVAQAGCSRRRDAVDRALIDQVRSLGRRGKVVVAEASEAGGPGTLAGGLAPVSTAADAVPDAWKRRHGLDPARPVSPDQPGTGGYTVLENYLNDRADGTD